MTRTKNLIALSLLVLSSFATGCIVEEEPPPIGPPPAESPDDEPSENVDSLPADDDLEGYECEDREARGCKVYLESHAGEQNCFVGVQYCVDGYWGECEDDPTGIYAAEAMDD